MTRPFVVLKFGGTSVAAPDGWRTIAAATRAHLDAGRRPLVVCSALAGVSDALDGLLPAAVGGRHEPILADLKRRHADLAAALGVEVDLSEVFEPLERLALGVSLTAEFTPRMRARAMATGELAATRLGAAHLRALGLPITWIDARDCLTTVEAGDTPAHALAARCDDHADPALAARLAAHDAILTQGFVARDPQGRTALLGRGGSDTSAALFAARVGAARCEIWTDVPGVYTTNPRDVPQARLLRRLDYDEAQELATAGAKVLHPRCLAPVRRHRIPLEVRCTGHPDLPGTVVGALEDGPAEVKAIAARRNVTLVSMDTLGMWQQVGFLAQVFGAFARHGVSVDLVSTSESNVTASFDPAAGAVDDATVAALLADLNQVCRARALRDCAAISLVGRQIRATLHRLGPALALFEDRRIHLVSQAASDLNLTFVVDAADADRLVARLHALLFDGREADDRLGPTWRETFSPPETPTTPAAPWWVAERDRLLAIEASPAYVYHGPTVDAAAARLLGLRHVDRVFYAIKANDHPALLRRLVAAGLGLECVSPGELDHVFAACPGLTPDRILFTPNFAPRAEYAAALARGVHVTVDNLHPLARWPEVFAGRSIFLRLDPGQGRGHHAKVRTAGRRSKFGVAPEELGAVADAAAAAGARVVGLHAHAGSGIREAGAWAETAVFLAEAAGRFPEVRVLDLGGGLGVREKPGQAALDLAAVDDALAPIRRAHPAVELWMEPGRYLVAEAGVLLARVQQTKTKGDKTYVGVDAGMHTLLRPALYGAWHGIVNLSRLDAPLAVTADVVGPICETGDVLGHARRLPRTEEGDRLLVATAGAYGRTMASGYNRRGAPAEVVLD